MLKSNNWSFRASALLALLALLACVHPTAQGQMRGYQKPGAGSGRTGGDTGGPGPASPGAGLFGGNPFGVYVPIQVFPAVGMVCVTQYDRCYVSYAAVGSGCGCISPSIGISYGLVVQ